MTSFYLNRTTQIADATLLHGAQRDRWRPWSWRGVMWAQPNEGDGCDHMLSPVRYRTRQQAFDAVDHIVELILESEQPDPEPTTCIYCGGTAEQLGSDVICSDCSINYSITTTFSAPYASCHNAAPREDTP